MTRDLKFGKFSYEDFYHSKKIAIFGVGEFARLAHLYFKFDSPFELIHDGHTCAVAIIFEDDSFSTLQYLAGSVCSFESNSQDYLMEKLVSEIQQKNTIRLLGTSTNPGDSHRTLSLGLDKYIHSFGAAPYSAIRMKIML